MIKTSEATQKAEKMLYQLFDRKANHEVSSQCCKHGCTGCHYWSGAISAVWELIGLTGDWHSCAEYKQKRMDYGL